MVDEVPSKTPINAEIYVTRAFLGIGKNPSDFSVLRAYREGTTACTIGARSGPLVHFPALGGIVETIAGDRADGAGIHALTAEFALQRSMKICVDHRFDPSF